MLMKMMLLLLIIMLLLLQMILLLLMLVLMLMMLPMMILLLLFLSLIAAACFIVADFRCSLLLWEVLKTRARSCFLTPVPRTRCYTHWTSPRASPIWAHTLAIDWFSSCSQYVHYKLEVLMYGQYLLFIIWCTTPSADALTKVFLNPLLLQLTTPVYFSFFLLL